MLLSTLEVLTADDLDSLSFATDSELKEFLLSLPEVDRDAIFAELIRRESPPEQTDTETTERLTLHEFGKQAWAVLRPGEQYIDGEHIRVLCAHLEYATDTPDYDLGVMMPPNCGKSIWSTVIWPAWVWGPRGWGAARFLITSYSEERGKDDAQKCKDLIESEWYQKLWPAAEVATDPVLAFSLTAGGQRKTAGTGGLGTGEHPHFVVVDDANKFTDPPKVFRAAVNWWKGQMSTRGIVSSIGSRHIAIGQRLRMDDVPKVCIDLGYDIVCMPMWSWPEATAGEVLRGDWRPKPTRLPQLVAEAYGLKKPIGSDGTVEPYTGWVDWREPGELLWPEGITETKARAVEAILGPIDAAAQLQQRPIRVAVNGLFPRSAIAEHMIDGFENIPWGEIDKIVRYWDKAGGTSDGADRTAGVCIGRWVKKSPAVGIPPEIRYIVLNVIVGRWNPFERNTVIRQTAEADVRLYGAKVELWLEKEARGGAGIESADISYRELAGYSPRFDPPTQSKLLRARPFSAAWHAGKVWIVVGTWNQTYLDEMEVFDGEEQAGIHDDCVDGSSGAAVKLINSGTSKGAAPSGARAKTGLSG